MYYAVPGRARAWRTFYRRFVQPRDLCFDIGAHVGSRSAALLAIGARVVAIEPQPMFAAVLRRFYSKNTNFTLVESGIGSTPGTAELLVSSRTPTVSTLSGDWAMQVGKTRSFAAVDWDQRLQIDVTTLDALIAIHGLPRFCKLDIEGAEHEALLGLSRAIPALSFEFLPMALDRANACIDRLMALDAYQFNYIKGEYPRFATERWMSADELRQQLAQLPDDGRAGEVYARLDG
jgi:FkbM family methyltransferase